ncbi:MAG: adenylate kinase [Gammaproteobacteria bacterium]|nr:adenylate kinase [Gammaproteobacteria bacterium]
MATYLVMIGPPGAGKGTQASRLSEKLGLAHVSTGDIFRDNIRNKTELGTRVKELLENGTLVPDELTIALVRDRLQQPDCRTGAVLDGFPRTPAQAAALDSMLAYQGLRVNVAPYISLDDEAVIERLAGRRTDRRTGKTYHLKFDPPPADAELEQRPDDNEETVQHRLGEYYENTAPLLDYYSERGVLQQFDGELSIDALTEALIVAVGEKTVA